MEKRTLEDRIRAIEDRLEIYNLIAGHPPSADTGADYFTRAVYVEDGELDLGRGKAMAGNEAIAAVTRTPAHQAAIAGGLAHFAGLPRIELDGDRAVVTSYLQILTPHPTAKPHEVSNHGVSNGFRIHRVAANRDGRSGDAPCAPSTARSRPAKSCAAHCNHTSVAEFTAATAPATADRLPPPSTICARSCRG